MTPEEIEYVREWAASGNEYRKWWEVLNGKFLPSGVTEKKYKQTMLVRLTKAGFIIAEQAERIRELESEHAGQIEYELMLREEYDELRAAFAQACEVAESAQWCLMQDVSGSTEPLKTMRSNRERLLRKMIARELRTGIDVTTHTENTHAE